jgi:hypothetical protein
MGESVNTAFLAHGGRQGTLGRPAALEPFEDYQAADLRLLSPRGEGSAFAAPFNVVVTARVAGLFFLGRPTAILRRVRTVVVDALNRLAWLTRPHVEIERHEVVKPTFAHGDPAPAVVGVRLVFRVVAALLNAAPALVLRSPTPAVCQRSRESVLILPAPTTDLSSGFQVAGVNLCKSTAFTDAFPSCAIRRTRDSLARYRQATKLPAGEVLDPSFRWHTPRLYRNAGRI